MIRAKLKRELERRNAEKIRELETCREDFDALIQRKKYAEAIAKGTELMSMIIQLPACTDPKEITDITYNLAICCDNIGNFDEAIITLNACKNINDNMLSYKAEILIKQTKFKESRKIFKELLSRSKDKTIKEQSKLYFTMLEIFDSNSTQNHLLHEEIIQAVEKCLQEKKLHIEQNLVYMKLGQYLYEIGEKEKAYEYLLKAKEFGSSAADGQLAAYYFENGEHKISIEHLKKAVEKGGKENSNSIFFLAYLYDTGENLFIEKDTEKAIQLYEKAVEYNEPQALHNLALKKLTGEDTAIDLVKGKELLEKAIELGQEKSKLQQGFCYLKGLGFAQDIDKAKEIFSILYSNNPLLLEAGFQLSVIYYNQSTAAKNLEESENLIKETLKIMEKLILEDHPGAIINAANIYDSGHPGITRNVTKAIEYYEKAVSLGWHSYKRELARIYFEIGDVTRTKGFLSQYLQVEQSTADELEKVITQYFKTQEKKCFSINFSILNILNSSKTHPTRKFKETLSVVKDKVTNFDSVNISTLIFHMGKIIKSSQINRILLQTAIDIIDFLPFRIPSIIEKLSPIDCSNIMIGLSNMLLDPKEPCIELTIKNTFSKISEKIDSFSINQVSHIFHALAKLGIYSTNHEDKAKIIKKLMGKTKSNSLLLYDLALVHSSSNEVKFQQTILQHASEIKIPSNKDQLDDIEIYQYLMALNYFEKNDAIETLASNNFYDEVKDLFNQKKFKGTESLLQKKINNMIRDEFKLQTETEYQLEGRLAFMPVDIFLPGKRLAIQVDGPTHFFYRRDSKRLSPQEEFKRKLDGGEVVHLDYEQWSGDKEENNNLLKFLTK